MKKFHYYGNLQNMHYIHFIRVEMNLPWQPFPESKTPAADKCVITPDEFARTQNRYGLGQCKRIAPKKLYVLEIDIDLILCDELCTSK